LRDHLPLPKNTMPDFIQHAIETSVETVICLDTHKVGSHAGELCATRLAWLDETLGNTQNKPALIFMRHPPLGLGLSQQDTNMLEDHEAFFDALSRNQNNQ